MMIMRINTLLELSLQEDLSTTPQELLNQLTKDSGGRVTRKIQHIDPSAVNNLRIDIEETGYSCHANLSDIILKMLTFLPGNRPDIRDIIEDKLFEQFFQPCDTTSNEDQIIPTNQNIRTVMCRLVEQNRRHTWLNGRVIFSALHLLDSIDEIIRTVTIVQYKLLSVTCLYLSHKYHTDTMPVEVDEIATMGNCNSEDIIRWEHTIIHYITCLFSLTPYDALSTVGIKMPSSQVFSYFNWCCNNKNVQSEHPIVLTIKYINHLLSITPSQELSTIGIRIVNEESFQLFKDQYQSNQQSYLV